MKRIVTSLALATVAFAVTACTGGQTGALPVTSVNPITTTVLQLAMGTANINGATGTNVVSTLRQPNGTSILFDTPTLSGPFNFAGSTAQAAAGTSTGTWSKGGPSAAEIAGGFIGGTSPTQTNPPNQAGAAIPASALTTFGLYGGLSATGFFESNSATSGAISTTTANVAGASVVPFPVPLYGTAAATGVTFTPWIGPPAFPGLSGLGSRDGTYANGLLGAAAGINVFDGITPGAGTYTMSVQIPTGFDANNNPLYGNQTTTAKLTAPATCIGGCGVPIPAPVIVPGGGGATITAVLPAGATGAILMVRDIGPATGKVNCYPGTVANNSATFGFPAVYTVAITASGNATLAANLGPRPSTTSTATPTICTAAQNAAAAGSAVGGDQVTVQMVAYNYNLLGLVPALSNSQTPPVPTGDADIGLSAISAVVVSP